MAVAWHVHDWVYDSAVPDVDPKYEIRTYKCKREGCTETQDSRTKKGTAK